MKSAFVNFTKKFMVCLLIAMIGLGTPVANVFDNSVITAEAATAKPKISKSKATICVGDTVTLQLKNVTSGVKWSTSKKAIATIKTNGTSVTVTGKKAGKATITATYKKKKYKCVVTVKAKPVSLSTKKKTIEVGNTFDLTLKNGGSGAKWSTSNKRVAAIKKVSNTKYTVTAQKAGTANIKVKYKNKTYTCKVTVKKSTICLSTTSLKVCVDGQSYIKLKGTSANSEWSIADTSIAKLVKKDKGEYEVYGLKTGTTTLTVTCNGETYKCSITVYDIEHPLVDTKGKKEGSVAINGSVQLALGNLKATEPTVWSVSDPSIVELVPDGSNINYRAYGLKSGTAVISAVCRGVTYKYTLTVTTNVVPKVYLSNNVINAKSGDIVSIKLNGASGTMGWSTNTLTSEGANNIKFDMLNDVILNGTITDQTEVTFKVGGSGTTRIVASYNGEKYYCKLVVTE